MMSGWKAKGGSGFLEGWLVKGDSVVTANVFGASSSHIKR
jgi:hypothetical protein